MHNTNPVEIEKRVEALFDLGKFQECIKLAQTYLYTSEVKQWILYIYIIYAYHNLKKYALADTFCDEALGAYPDIGTFLYLKALTLLAQNKVKSAQTYIEKALAMDANNADYLSLYADIYLQLNKHKKAKEMIDKALVLESNNLDFQLLDSIILYHLDKDKEAEIIVNNILKQDPFNEAALDMKQTAFATKMGSKKGILAQLLRQNPFEQKYQKDMKFIKFYYRYIPAMMILSMLLTYLANSIEWLTPIKPFILPIVGITAFIGAQDKRFNIPFLMLVSSIGLYFDNAASSAYLGAFILVILLDYFFYGLLILARAMIEVFKEKVEHLKSENMDIFNYVLISYPFYEEGKVDKHALKRYYTTMGVLIVGSLATFFLYRVFEVSNTPLQLSLIVIFLIVGTKSAKNLLLTAVYIFMTVLIINDFEYTGDMIYFLFTVLFGVSIFSGISSYIKRRRENE